MALRLSPRVAAMNASACSAPARRSVSWSVPSPRILRPRKPAGRWSKAYLSRSRMAMLCPSASSITASSAPRRPQPMMRMSMSVRRHAQEDDLAAGRLQDVLRPAAKHDLAVGAPEGHREDDGVCLALRRLVDDGVAGVARLQEVALYLEVLAPRRHLCLREGFLSPPHLDDVDDVHLAARALGDGAGELDGQKTRLRAVYRHQDRLEGQGRLFALDSLVTADKHAGSPAKSAVSFSTYALLSTSRIAATLLNRELNLTSVPPRANRRHAAAAPPRPRWSRRGRCRRPARAAFAKRARRTTRPGAPPSCCRWAGRLRPALAARSRCRPACARSRPPPWRRWRGRGCRAEGGSGDPPPCRCRAGSPSPRRSR